MKREKQILSAEMVDFHTIAFQLRAPISAASMQKAKLLSGKQEIAALVIPDGDGETDRGVLCAEQKLDLRLGYRVQLHGFGSKAVIPTKVFDCPEFVQEFIYDGDDLGATVVGNGTVFKVWAPTASGVVLNLFTDGSEVPACASIPMTKGSKGVWESTQPCGHGTYYTFTVTTAAGTQETADVYGKSAGVNGQRSMVVDFSKTNPSGWDLSRPVTLKRYTDAILWEVHVRDFSNTIRSSQYPGKFLAFTERGLRNKAGLPVGVDYLVDLGVTHVHLLPVADFATVDEGNPDKRFNWGYDPQNYNVPEGSYSTDPFHGAVRVQELKQLICAMHEMGLGVVLDVVYNHTYSKNSAFQKTVPYYYYRILPNGTFTSASGCGNDTASERLMYRKFMVDSVRFWMQEYKLDGFRFDLMGLHDLQTMEKIEKAAHAINPCAILYGEGWDMGSTLDGSLRATQGNIGAIEPLPGAAGGIAVFNDAMRDGLKGSVFDQYGRGYISGNTGWTANLVRFGILGGESGEEWSVPNAGVINYMSAHDNHTLWDKLSLSNAEESAQRRMARNRLGAAILMISRGTPFWQAGEEMLRTKGGDGNSYRSGDAVNNLRWEKLTPNSDEYAMTRYYKGLIKMRKAFPVFTAVDADISIWDLPHDGMAVFMDDRAGSRALVLINPSQETLWFDLGYPMRLVADGELAGSTALQHCQDSVEVLPVSIQVWILE